MGSYDSAQRRGLGVPPMPTLRSSSRTGPAQDPETAWTRRPATVAMRARRSHSGMPSPTITSWSQRRAMRSNALLWSARTRAGHAARSEWCKWPRMRNTCGAASPSTRSHSSPWGAWQEGTWWPEIR
eukprot:12787136-Alexandrium_andersonii.AAC.2